MIFRSWNRFTAIDYNKPSGELAMTLEQPISRQKDLSWFYNCKFSDLEKALYFVNDLESRFEANRSLFSKQLPDLMRQIKFEREPYLYIMRKYVYGTIDELSWNTAAMNPKCSGRCFKSFPRSTVSTQLEPSSIRADCLGLRKKQSVCTLKAPACLARSLSSWQRTVRSSRSCTSIWSPSWTFNLVISISFSKWKN